MIEAAEGTELIDTEGRRYLDGVSSLWCNVHGHRHPAIDAAVREQLDRVAHSTMLGPLPPRAPPSSRPGSSRSPPPGLNRVFYSDSGLDGGRGRAQDGVPVLAAPRRPARPEDLVHLPRGGLPRGHDRLGLRRRDAALPLAPSSRCSSKSHRAKPGDVDDIARLLAMREEEVAAVVIEPLVQGAAGMLTHPPGYLRAVRRLCDRHGALLICDEVATGFGRTGTMFACEQEGVSPDLLCVAKGLTGGLHAARRDPRHRADLRGLPRRPSELKTFFHGHTYTGNPLACAAAIASLDVFERERTLVRLQPKIRLLSGWLGAGRADARGAGGPPARPDGRHRPRRARSGAAARPPRRARGARAGASSSARSAT